MFKKIILWILVIGCMTLIFSFSSEAATESRKTSASFIEKIISFFDFDNSITESEMFVIRENMTFIVRKGAHFSIYALLGLLIYLLLCEYNINDKKVIIIAVTVSMLYACSDEIHQSFVEGRSGELRDVLIDTVGALAGCTATFLIKRMIRKTNKQEVIK